MFIFLPTGDPIAGVHLGKSERGREDATQQVQFDVHSIILNGDDGDMLQRADRLTECPAGRWQERMSKDKRREMCRQDNVSMECSSSFVCRPSVHLAMCVVMASWGVFVCLQQFAVNSSSQGTSVQSTKPPCSLSLLRLLAFHGGSVPGSVLM